MVRIYPFPVPLDLVDIVVFAFRLVSFALPSIFNSLREEAAPAVLPGKRRSGLQDLMSITFLGDPGQEGRLHNRDLDGPQGCC